MPRRKSKYNVSKDKQSRTYNDITFDSKMEMEYYRDVVLPAYNTGEIANFELQKHFILQPRFRKDGGYVRPIEYVADFYIVDKEGNETIVDVKGMADATAKIKRKMVWYHYPDLKYLWLTYSKKYGGWIEYEKLQAYRRTEKKRQKEHRKLIKGEEIINVTENN